MSESLHRALAALPLRRAPKTLLPRVLAAARAEDPYGAWWTWSAPARWSYALAIAGGAAFSFKAGWSLAEAGAALLPAAEGLAAACGTLARAFWLAGGRPLMGASLVMAFACAAMSVGLIHLTQRPQVSGRHS
ncbi:MAG TPA: hypothetical protein DCM05_13750 [Elusimicrobia bacterium]|nr:hypothetical protein [Elusimicrobiota bacterium]